MADFGGWEMPIEYPATAGGGVINEHTAVRERVGLFDVSHLGKAIVQGKGARAFIDSAVTNDLSKINPGQAQYTMLCDEKSGGVIDDLIVYLRSDEEILLVPNAANNAEVVSRLQGRAPSGVTITNAHNDYAVLAVQGPLSSEVLESLGLPTSLDYMSFVEAEYHGQNIVICRTGYTGERGFEILPPWDYADVLWRELVEKVEARGGLVAGLGARDTLRTEMCYPLHGHELSMTISPLEANASWAVGWNKESFWGDSILRRQKSEGVTRVLRPLIFTDRGIPRADMKVRNESGAEIGIVTSGTFSPTLKQGVALALIDPAVKVGEVVDVDVRGRLIKASVAKAPLVPSHVR